MSRSVSLAILAAAAVFGAAQPAAARVDINVDLSAQTMEVTSSSGSYSWPISSARDGYTTPHGTFGVQRMEAMHLSHKYHNSPMPHSLFFTGGYAIHGSYEIAALGTPASHGCIRLSPGHAAQLYRMVAAEGGRISITGTPPDGDLRYAGDSAERTGDDELESAPRREHFRRASARQYSRGYPIGGEGSYGFGAYGYYPVTGEGDRGFFTQPDDF